MWDATDYFKSQAIPIPIISSSEKVDIGDNDNNNNLDCTRTDPCTHENMVVLGKNFHITNCTGRAAEVQPFLSGTQVIELSTDS